MLIIPIIICLLLSALFSGAEIAFISASKLEVELKKMQGSRRGGIMGRWYDKPAQFLSTMLVGNNIALVLFTILMGNLMEPTFTAYFGMNEGVFLLTSTLVITIVVLIFGEFLPKTIFRLFSNSILFFLVYPLQFVRWLLAFPAWVMTQLSKRLLRLIFKTPIGVNDNVITRLDLENYIKGTRLQDSDDEIDADLFGKALHLRTVKVRECMVPRTEIVDVDVNDSLDQLKQIITETKLSRVIVTEGDVDNVLGYVHHQQLFTNPSSIKKMIIDIPFVPEAMRVRDLMDKLIKARINIACVVDEYGGIAGVITLEDILEEIFGEIEDEHDNEEHVETQISETEFVLAGRLEIDYLNEKYEALEFPDGDYATLSGYLVMTSQSIPEQGATIILEGYQFNLELVSETKIETVRVIKLPTTDEKMA